MIERPGRPLAGRGAPPRRPIVNSGRSEQPRNPRPAQTAPARSNSGGRREFQYVRRTPETVRAVMDESRSRFDSCFRGRQVKWKDGVNIARILPATWKNPKGHFAMKVYEHRYIGSEKSHYLCLEKQLNKRCPICEAERQTRTAGDKDAADALRTKLRWVMYVLNRKDENPLQPVIWDIWNRANEEILEVTQDHKTGACLFPEHLDEGYDLSFRRSGQGDRTQYGGWQFDRDPSPAAEDASQIDEVLAFIEEHPLDEMLRYYEPDYLEKVLYGTAEAPDEDLDTSASGDDYNVPNEEMRDTPDVAGWEGTNYVGEVEDQEPPFEEDPRQPGPEPEDDSDPDLTVAASRQRLVASTRPAPRNAPATPVRQRPRMQPAPRGGNRYSE